MSSRYVDPAQMPASGQPGGHVYVGVSTRLRAWMWREERPHRDMEQQVGKTLLIRFPGDRSFRFGIMRTWTGKWIYVSTKPGTAIVKGTLVDSATATEVTTKAHHRKQRTYLRITHHTNPSFVNVKTLRQLGSTIP